MSFKQLAVITAIGLFAASCKKDQPPQGIEADIKTYYSLQNSIAKQFQETISDTVIDEVAHSERLLEWIQQQPDVTEAIMHSVYAFEVKHTNGLSGNIIFTPKQTDMRLRTRGGGGGTDGKLNAFKTSEDEKIITNKNVLVIAQYARDFYSPYAHNCTECKHIQQLLDLFEYADIEFDVTVKVDEGISAFMDMSDYGIIIISTHGTPTGVASGEDIFYTENLVAFSDDVEVAPLPENAGSWLRDGGLKLTSFWEFEKATKEMTILNASYELTFSFFESLPVQFDNTVMIGNYCYSGIQNGIMGDILAPKGLKTFYGYGYPNGRSYEVTNDLAWRAEDTIITNLIALDTTGIAHLSYNTTQLQDDRFWQDRLPNPHMRQRLAEKFFIFTPQPLNQYLDPGYHFEKCGEPFVDARDGTEYPTVCIGDQVWMAKNLNFSGAGVCYDNDPNNCDQYGRLYSIQELTNLEASSTDPSGVRGLCPEGWHVPSTAEWIKLFEEVGGPGKLCAPSDWPQPNNNTNEFGLNIQPGGRYSINFGNGIFNEVQDYGHFWSASTSNDGNFYRSVLFHINQGSNSMSYNDEAELQFDDFANYGTHYFSCRCVKD